MQPNAPYEAIRHGPGGDKILLRVNAKKSTIISNLIGAPIMMVFAVCFFFFVSEAPTYGRGSIPSDIKGLLYIMIALMIAMIVVVVLKTVSISKSFVCVCDGRLYGVAGKAAYFMTQPFDVSYAQITNIGKGNSMIGNLKIECGPNIYGCQISDPNRVITLVKQQIERRNYPSDTPVSPPNETYMFYGEMPNSHGPAPFDGGSDIYAGTGQGKSGGSAVRSDMPDFVPQIIPDKQAAAEPVSTPPSLILLESRQGMQKEHPLIGAQQYTIGRMPMENAVIIDDQAVSSKHCELTLYGGRALIMDLNSSNGTMVNGTKIEGRHPVARGDIIQIGKTTLEITEILI